MLVAGGQRPDDPACPGVPRGLRYTFLFDPMSEAWGVAGPQLNPHLLADGRWYPTLTTLGEDPGYRKVLAMSGLRSNLSGNCAAVVNKDPEIYNLGNGWSQMADPPQAVQPFGDLYTGAHVIPFGSRAGKVFYSSPMKQAWVFDPFFGGQGGQSAPGYWTAVGPVRSTHRNDGNSVLLPLLPGATTAKVLIVGGDNPGTKTAEIMDVARTTPTWTAAASMFFARRNANAVILPDDTIVVVGGNLTDLVDDPVYTAELYDVAGNTWRMLPAMNRRRVYHSTAVLLPDGRVWASGTHLNPAFEFNIELYSPGYLFEGNRPVITNAPATVNYGTTFVVDTSVDIASIRLIHLGAATHATNMDQRSIGLAFSATNPTNGPSWNVTASANANVAPPGMYMLFVLRPKAASLSGATSIPSVAKIVNVKYPTT